MILDTPLATDRLFDSTVFRSAVEYPGDATFVFDGERHDFRKAVRVISGEAECNEDDKVYILHENHRLFHAPKAFHKIRSSAQTSPHLFILCF